MSSVLSCKSLYRNGHYSVIILSAHSTSLTKFSGELNRPFFASKSASVTPRATAHEVQTQMGIP